MENRLLDMDCRLKVDGLFRRKYHRLKEEVAELFAEYDREDDEDQEIGEDVVI